MVSLVQIFTIAASGAWLVLWFQLYRMGKTDRLKTFLMAFGGFFIITWLGAFVKELL